MENIGIYLISSFPYLDPEEYNDEEYWEGGVGVANNEATGLGQGCFEE